jgi:hypothetical protein
LVQQAKAINNITVNKTVNTAVHKDVNITHVQNVSVLAPLPKVRHVPVTALASLGRPRGAAPAAPPIDRRVRIEKVGRDRLAEERKVASHYRAVAAERSRHQARLVQSAAVPLRPTDKPARVKHDLPKAPAHLKARPAKAAPPPPKAPRHEDHPKRPRKEPPAHHHEAHPERPRKEPPAHHHGAPRRAGPPHRD